LAVQKPHVTVSPLWLPENGASSVDHRKWIVTGNFLSRHWDGFASVVPFVNGFVIGFTGGIAVSLIELFLLQSARKRTTFLIRF
jgi:hypothetical protein